MAGAGHGAHNITHGGLSLHATKGWHSRVGQGMSAVMWYVTSLPLWSHFLGLAFAGFWFSMGHGVCWNQTILSILAVSDPLCHISPC